MSLGRGTRPLGKTRSTSGLTGAWFLWRPTLLNIAAHKAGAKIVTIHGQFETDASACFPASTRILPAVPPWTRLRPPRAKVGPRVPSEPGSRRGAIPAPETPDMGCSRRAWGARGPAPEKKAISRYWRACLS